MPTSRFDQSAVKTSDVSVLVPTVKVMGTLLVVYMGSSPAGGAMYALVVASFSLDSDVDDRGAWMWALGSNPAARTAPMASNHQSKLVMTVPLAPWAVDVMPD